MKTDGIKPLTRVVSGLFSILTGFLFLLPSGVSAQKVSADTTRFLIGNQINISLELEMEAGSRVYWPELGDTLTGSIEIISKNKPDTVRSEGATDFLIRQQITITSFDTGFIVLPPLTFRLTHKNGTTEDLKSEPLLLEVKNVKVDTTKDIRDIKPIVEAPYTFRDFLPWILLAAATGLLATLIWFYLRNRKRNKPLIRMPLKQQKPPDIIALGLLEELRKEQVWQKGQVKEYYTRLTDILRDYFEKRFGVSAAEMTSDEILSAMKGHITEASVINDLRKLLTLSDLAKFAKVQPIGAENELSMTYARAIVMNTAATPLREENGNTRDSESVENRNLIKE